jgi:hypothetical protein
MEEVERRRMPKPRVRVRGSTAGGVNGYGRYRSNCTQKLDRINRIFKINKIVLRGCTL